MGLNGLSITMCFWTHSSPGGKGGGKCYISQMCGLKKGRMFRRSVSTFLQMVFGGALALIWSKLFLFLFKGVGASWLTVWAISAVYFFWSKVGTFDVIFIWVLRFNTNLRSLSNGHYSQTPLYRHAFNTDTSLLRTNYFFPGERKPSYFLFKLFNTGTSLIRRLSMAPSVLTGFGCILVSLWP